MKSFMLAAVLLSSSMALAYIPSSGDYASFDITQTDRNGNVIKGLYEVQIDNYDPSFHTYLETITFTYEGQWPRVQQRQVYENQLVSDAQIQDSLLHCSQYGGDIETVQTGVGPLDSCA